MPFFAVSERIRIKTATHAEHFQFPPGELERYEAGGDVAIMLYVLRHKVQQHRNLRAMLLATGDRLIAEDSPRDRNWGTGAAAPSLLTAGGRLSVSHRPGRGHSQQQPSGLNKLGICWMALRAELRESEAAATGGPSL